MFSILLIENDLEAQELISLFLQHKRFSVICASNCEDAYSLLDDHYVSMIILHRTPSLEGADLFMETNRTIGCDIPTLVISESSALSDIQEAFKNGADDYMIKPIRHKELYFRIEAILRRSKQVYKKIIRIGEAILDYDSLMVSLPIGRKICDIVLPQKEFHILFLLLSSPNRIFSRQQIMNEIWDFNTESNEKTVDVHVNRLRNKLKNNKDFEIVTIRNVGYKAIIKRTSKSNK